MGFVHNINPVLLELGPLEIRYYGLVYLLGFLVGYLLLDHYRKKGKLRLSKEDLESYIIYLIVGSIVGARLFHIIFWDISHFLSNPLEIFMLWKGGMSFHGGIFGAVLVSYYFCKKKNISLAKLADLLAVYTAFIFAVGRIANFINGELWGTVTNVSWCVKFQGADGCRHPYQLYSALKRFAVMGVIFILSKRKHKSGFLFWSFIGLVGLGRFFLDFLRADPKFLGLVAGQWLSLVMVMLAGYALLMHYRKDLGFKR
jgi:phosphatidylglycerol:prolipoprotein diacylglycerol transferase